MMAQDRINYAYYFAYKPAQCWRCTVHWSWWSLPSLWLPLQSPTMDGQLLKAQHKVKTYQQQKMAVVFCSILFLCVCLCVSTLESVASVAGLLRGNWFCWPSCGDNKHHVINLMPKSSVLWFSKACSWKDQTSDWMWNNKSKHEMSE